MSRTVSHYRIEAELGRGGMGVVYRATDTRLGRSVVIKMLPSEATADVDRNRRFVQEFNSVCTNCLAHRSSTSAMCRWRVAMCRATGAG